MVITEPGRLIVTKPAVPMETVPEETVPEVTVTAPVPAPQPDVEPNPVQLPENETVVEPEWNSIPEPISEPIAELILEPIPETTPESMPEPKEVPESKTVSAPSTVSESKAVSIQEETPDSHQKLLPLSDTKIRKEEKVPNSAPMGDKADERIWICFWLIFLLLIEEQIRNRKNQNRERQKVLAEKPKRQAEMN